MRRSPDSFRSLALCGLTLLALASPAVADEGVQRHIEGQTVEPIVESPEALKVSSVIQCYCGGCVNQTIHECTCGFAAAERAKIASRLAAGETPEGLIAAYVAERGAQVRIVPERKGFNLIGWAIPWIATVAGIALLGAVLVAWSRRGARATAQHPAPPSAESKRWREQTEKELKEMES